MIDLVELFMGDQVGILSNHQQESAPGTEPVYPWLNGPAGTIWEMKNSNGWPADGYAFDNKYIYQTVTEIDPDAANYNNPKSYKKFTAAPGIVWAPRFYADDSEWEPVQSPSQYLTVLNGAAQPLKDLGGPTEVGFGGPFNDADFGGNIGAKPYYLQSYKWGANFSTMEQNAYIMGIGRVRWQNWKIVNGVYTLLQTSLYNTSVAGPCPKLAFIQ